MVKENVFPNGKRQLLLPGLEWPLITKRFGTDLRR